MLKRPAISFYLKNAFTDMKGIKLRMVINNVLPLFLMFLAILGVSNVLTLNVVNVGMERYVGSLTELYNNEIKYEVDNISRFLDYNKKYSVLTKQDAMMKVNSYIKSLKDSDENQHDIWIFDTTGKVIATSQEAANSQQSMDDPKYKKYLEKITEVSKSEDGYLYADFSYKVKDDETTMHNSTSYFYYYKPYDWVISSSYNKDDLNNAISEYTSKTNKELKDANILCFVVGLLLFFFSSAITAYIGISVTEWIKELFALTKSMKKGILTTRLQHDYKHELKDTSNAINEVQDNFVNLITKIDTIASNLTKSVENFNENHMKMNSSIDNISHSIFDITENINHQALATSNMSSNIGDISNSINNTSMEIDLLTKNSEAMQTYSIQSMDSLNKLLNINERTKHDIEEMYNQTKHTNDSVEKISKAAELINEIATQTNLLSLNASIEAARAGENGRGFAVVASEIGNLATQSSVTVTEINALLEELTTNSSKSINIVKEMTNASGVQNETILETSETFNNLMKNLEICIKSIKSIYSQIQVVNEKRDIIVSNLEQLNDISSNNAASTQETSAMSEELTDMVSLSSKEISALVEEFSSLEEGINQFTFK